MKNKIFVQVFLVLFIFFPSFASKDHAHAKHEEHKEHKEHKEDKHDDHDDHDDHNDHNDHDDHGGGKVVGVGKAIEEVDEVKGLKLSKEAIKSLDIKLSTVNNSLFEISKDTLVASKNIKGVYRFRSGFFKFLEAVIIKEIKDGYKVEVTGIELGDQIVVGGVGLLRVADVYSTDTAEYGHSH